jgi:hypothetical protein
MFGGINENFVTTTVKGALIMAGDCIHFDALQSPAAESRKSRGQCQKNGGAPSTTTIY